ncbi:hypothetical protein ACUY2J_08365 [Corynebacterium kroppenstedtii]
MSKSRVVWRRQAPHMGIVPYSALYSGSFELQKDPDPRSLAIPFSTSKV